MTDVASAAGAEDGCRLGGLSLSLGLGSLGSLGVELARVGLPLLGLAKDGAERGGLASAPEEELKLLVRFSWEEALAIVSLAALAAWRPGVALRRAVVVVLGRLVGVSMSFSLQFSLSSSSSALSSSEEMCLEGVARARLTDVAPRAADLVGVALTRGVLEGVPLAALGSVLIGQVRGSPPSATVLRRISASFLMERNWN